MATIPMTCRRCGAKFAFPVSEAVFPCPNCGALHERPPEQQEAFTGLSRANDKRASGEYAVAMQIYQDVLQRAPKSHEALWGLVLCKYGVEYVEDQATHRRRPTLHFLQRKPILSDDDYSRACRYAPEEIAAQYRADAEYIAHIYQILMQGGEDLGRFDIFLCYKGSGPEGKGKAREYEHALKLYYHLEKAGFRVFFAQETLKRAAGAKYEAVIYHALHAAKVMLVICSDPANLMTPWVHSEWTRFLRRLYDGENCRLIPLLYDGCEANALPLEVSCQQGISMSDPDAFEALKRNLHNCVGNTTRVAAAPKDAAEVEDELLTIEYALTNKRWEDAASWSERLIRKHPRCARAYFMLLLAKRRIAAPAQLGQCLEAFEEDSDWAWALRHASDAEKQRFDGLLQQSLAAREAKRRADEEQKRQEEARRREAEKKRIAEEERRAEERRRRLEEERQEQERQELVAKQKAEFERLAEEKLRAEEAERQKKIQRDKEAAQYKEWLEQQRFLVEEELNMGRWDEAKSLCRNLANEPRDLTLRLFTKYHIREKNGFASAHPDCFKDKMWHELLEKCGKDDKERERLLGLEQVGKENWHKSKRWVIKTICANAVALLTAGVAVCGASHLMGMHSDLMGTISLGMASVVVFVYLLLTALHGDEILEQSLKGVGAIVFGLGAGFIVYTRQWNDNVCLWSAIGLSVLMLLMLVIRVKKWHAEPFDQPMHLPPVWLIVHTALNLLYSVMSWEWLMTVDQFVIVWLVPADLLCLAIALIWFSYQRVKELRY